MLPKDAWHADSGSQGLNHIYPLLLGNMLYMYHVGPQNNNLHIVWPCGGEGSWFRGWLVESGLGLFEIYVNEILQEV